MLTHDEMNTLSMICSKISQNGPLEVTLADGIYNLILEKSYQFTDFNSVLNLIAVTQSNDELKIIVNQFDKLYLKGGMEVSVDEFAILTHHVSIRVDQIDRRCMS